MALMESQDVSGWGAVLLRLENPWWVCFWRRELRWKKGAYTEKVGTVGPWASDPYP